MPDAAYYREYRRRNGDEYRAKSRERNHARYAERRVWLASLKQAAGCQHCGENYAPALEFHHLDATTKERHMASGLGISEARFLDELRGCVLLCCNCHRKVHGGVLDTRTLPRVDFTAVAATMELLEDVPVRSVNRAGRPRKAA